MKKPQVGCHLNEVPEAFGSQSINTYREYYQAALYEYFNLQ